MRLFQCGFAISRLYNIQCVCMCACQSGFMFKSANENGTTLVLHHVDNYSFDLVSQTHCYVQLAVDPD
jgi:hypothetical protein